MLYLGFGVFLGLIVGILPGLGGTAGLALLLPFVYGMEPGYACTMMIGLQSVTATSDTFPSVLMGIPGTASSQATIVDGFPLSKQGQAARALGAAFSASLFGGLFGAVVLTGAIVVAEPIILAMGFGEQMMLIILALTMVGMLTGSHPAKGLAACGNLHCNPQATRTIILIGDARPHGADTYRGLEVVQSFVGHGINLHEVHVPMRVAPANEPFLTP